MSMKKVIAAALVVGVIALTGVALSAFAKPKESPIKYTLSLNWDNRLHRLSVELLDMSGSRVESLKPRRGTNSKDRCYVVTGIRPRTRIDVPDGWMIDSDIRFSEGLDGAGDTFRAPDGSKGQRFYGGESLMTKKSLSDITIRAPQF